MAFQDVLGSSYDYQKTELGIQKRFGSLLSVMWIFSLRQVEVWTKAPYPLLILPNANLSYLVQPESYTNMNAMEFINDEYASWDITYFMNGVIEPYSAYQELKWRGLFFFPGYVQSLTDKNNPYIGEQNEGFVLYSRRALYLMDPSTPYMERRVSVSRISLSSCVWIMYGV